MKHRNEQCSLCVMRECILRQVAPRLAQIKRNWPADTHQQSRRSSGPVAGPRADGCVDLDLQGFSFRVSFFAAR